MKAGKGGVEGHRLGWFVVEKSASGRRISPFGEESASSQDKVTQPHC